MLTKLEHYGIRGIGHNWLKIYLISRFQCINFDEKTQKKLQFTLVLHASSISGPLLFIIHLNNELETGHAYKKFNLLYINMEKCCFVYFQLRKLSQNNNQSVTLKIVSNNHVSQAIYIES